MYKIDDDDEWKEYNENDTVYINNNQTIYARGSWKGIQNYEFQTEILSYTKIEELEQEAYDGNEETFVKMYYNDKIQVDSTRYLSVDESIWNKKVKIKWWNWAYPEYYSTITFLDKDDKNIQEHIIYPGKIEYEDYIVPENTTRIKYYVMFAAPGYANDTGFGRFYEIQPTN